MERALPWKGVGCLLFGGFGALQCAMATPMTTVADVFIFARRNKTHTPVKSLAYVFSVWCYSQGWLVTWATRRVTVLAVDPIRRGSFDM